MYEKIKNQYAFCQVQGNPFFLSKINMWNTILFNIQGNLLVIFYLSWQQLHEYSTHDRTKIKTSNVRKYLRMQW